MQIRLLWWLQYNNYYMVTFFLSESYADPTSGPAFTFVLNFFFPYLLTEAKTKDFFSPKIR